MSEHIKLVDGPPIQMRFLVFAPHMKHGFFAVGFLVIVIYHPISWIFHGNFCNGNVDHVLVASFRLLLGLR